VVNELVKHLGAARRRDFKREYGTYLQRSGLPIKPWPILGGAEVDLSHLHEQVKRRGGYDSVGRNRQWMEMVRGMGVPLANIKSAMSTQLRELYVKHLLVRSPPSPRRRHLHTSTAVRRTALRCAPVHLPQLRPADAGERRRVWRMMILAGVRGVRGVTRKGQGGAGRAGRLRGQ
jgi:hypothetical protein